MRREGLLRGPGAGARGAGGPRGRASFLSNLSTKWRGVVQVQHPHRGGGSGEAGDGALEIFELAAELGELGFGAGRLEQAAAAAQAEVDL
jgi:hypothetical protein